MARRHKPEPRRHAEGDNEKMPRDTEQPSAENEWEAMARARLQSVFWWLGILNRSERRGSFVEDVRPRLYVTPVRVIFDAAQVWDPRECLAEATTPAHEALMAFLHDIMLCWQCGAERKADDPDATIDLRALLKERGWSDHHLAVFDFAYAGAWRDLQPKFASEAVPPSLRKSERASPTDRGRTVAIEGLKELLWAEGEAGIKDVLRPRLIGELFWYAKQVLEGDDDFRRPGKRPASRIGRCEHCRRPFVRKRLDQDYCERGCQKAEAARRDGERVTRRHTRAFRSAEELPLALDRDRLVVLLRDVERARSTR